MIKKLWVALVSLGIMLFAGGMATVHAENLTYSVSTNLPSNQINKDITYFDLKVKPGASQNLSINIQNSSSKAGKFRIYPNRAATNENGVIDYSKHGLKKDKSLPKSMNFEKMMPKSRIVTVPAKSSKTFTLKLNVPKREFDGIVLGGIRVKQLDNNSTTTNQKGVTIANQFAYVIGVQLQENDNVVKPNMKLLKIKPKQINYRNNIAVQLQNPNSTLMHYLNIKAHVTKYGETKVLYKYHKKDMGMAPNSNFWMPISVNNDRLKAGKYTLTLDAKAEKGEYHWHFVKNFTIKNSDARHLNHTAVGQKPNYMMWIIIAAVIIILLLLIIIWLLLKNRKNQNDK